MSRERIEKRRPHLTTVSKLAVVFVAALAARSATGQWSGESGKQSPDKAYAKLVEEFNRARRDFYKPFYEAKTPEERSKVRLDYTKDPRREYVKKFLAFADKHRKTSAARRALVWLCRNGATASPGGDDVVKKAIDRLLEDHIDDEGLAGALASLVYVYDLDAEPVFKRIMKESPHRKVQGMACYYLAEVIRRKGGPSGSRDAEAVALLERVKREFGDLPHYRGNLGKAVEGDLFELRNLAIGKTAPEIVGRDVDGVELKLSDYRGKVVVIDFWGDW